MAWEKAGPFEVWIPDGPVQPAHERMAVGIKKTGDSRQIISCSRREWDEFVAAVKSGALDVEVPGGDRR